MPSIVNDVTIIKCYEIHGRLCLLAYEHPDREAGGDLPQSRNRSSVN
jgi:hypothetical protein